jgi:hypothetical protein
MAKRYGSSLLLVLLCLVLCAAPARAAWVKDGVVLSAQPFNQSQPKLAVGEDGAPVVIWQDYRNGTDWNIYVNKIGPDGTIYGGAEGLPICTAPGDQFDYDLIPDGTGGGIAVWSDYRDGDGNSDIYAQRVSGEGIPQWTNDGVPICTTANSHNWPRIVTDGAGGAIIAWSDYRDGQWDIYAQRITGEGEVLWPTDGVPVDLALGDQYSAEIVPDGSGGAILAWVDTRNGDGDLYAQRIDGAGNVLWVDAVPICLASGYPGNPDIVAASGGGAYVAWGDYRNGFGDIFVQKIDQDGLVAWQTDGIALCPESWNKYSPRIVEDGSGGVIVAWYDQRNYYEVYAQRMDAEGNSLWSQYGVLVFPSYGDGDIRLVSDGSGGAIAALDIYYDEMEPSDIYAQKMDQNGNVLWGTNGAAVCLAENSQYAPVLVPDGFGGAILAWEDYRANDGSPDIYCQRVGSSGLWGSPEPKIVSCLDVPMDQGGWVRIKTRASALDAAGETGSAIMGYNVWRMIGSGGGPMAVSAGAATPGAANAPAIDRSKLAALLADPATANGVRVSGPEAVSLGLPPAEWESVGFWFATRDTLYSVVVPTKNDSTAAGVPLEYFIVTAHLSTAGMFVVSALDSGYSVDNLPPGMTPGFAGAEVESPPGLALSWNPNDAPDLWKYDVHRGDDESFVPDQSNQIGTTDGTMIVDGSWVKAYMYFYKLVAVDRHGNTSVPALLRPQDIKVGTTLASFAAALSGAAVEISWTLTEAGADARFVVLRSAAATGAGFEELASPQISRSGLSFSMADRGVEPGTTYRYRVNVVDEAGSRTLFETEAISTPAMPLTLNQNHPNPFNPSTTIGYYLPVDATVTLDVYDTSGRLVARLLNGAKQAKGTHSVAWRGLDAQGRQSSSGVYFYRLTSGKETISKKMVLLR